MLIIKEPIKVICVKTFSSKKLIKGAIYLATNITTDSISKTRHIRIPIGLYSIDCFTLLDGKSLSNFPDFAIKYQESLNANINYTNQLVRCRYSSGKYLKTGEIYYVESQKTKLIKNWSGNLYPYTQIRIRGMRNWVSMNNFEEMHISEQRKIKLKNLNGEKIKTGEETRKFLHYTEKERIQIFFQLLSSSLIDINSAELTEQINISKLILNKGKQYNIIEEDIKPFLNNLKPILKPYNFGN